MFGEYEEMVLYHAVLIYTMFGVLMVGMSLPFLSSICNKTIKRIRIYMFVSHALLTMIAFTGLIAFVFAKMSMSIEIITMIVAFFVMVMVEVLKYKQILKAGNSEGCAKTSRTTTLLYTLINIAIITGLVLYKIMEAKSAISVS